VIRKGSWGKRGPGPFSFPVQVVLHEKIDMQYLMASQKVRPAALLRFFRTSTYLMYAFTPEKPPRLAGRNFCLAILWIIGMVKFPRMGGGFTVGFSRIIGLGED
jgi:hypothetical protein